MSWRVQGLTGMGRVPTRVDGKRQVVALTPDIAVLDLEAIA